MCALTIAAMLLICDVPASMEHVMPPARPWPVRITAGSLVDTAVPLTGGAEAGATAVVPIVIHRCDSCK
jgi:hypothetical protein